jgi:hypothetical protein
VTNIPQRSFCKGEITPALYARSDQVAYATGLRTCRNFLVKRTGGVDNRPGTELVGVAAGDVVRLIPFVFNDDQTYVLEFTNTLVRFIRDGAYLGAPYSVGVPYAAADLADIQFTQSGDVLTLVHPSYPPAELSRLADTTWIYSVIVFGPSITPPASVSTNYPVGTGVNWVVTALSATGDESVASTSTGVVSLPTSGTVLSVVWTEVAGAIGYNLYKSFGGGSYGFIGTAGPEIFVAPYLIFEDTGLTPDYTRQPPLEDADLFAVVDEYPAAIAYYQQRTVYGGAVNAPQTIRTSRTGNLTNFTTSTPIQDDDAITFTIVSKKANQIRHIVDTGSEMLVLTSGAEWTVDGDAAGVLRPTDINARQVSQHGASTLAPIQMERRTLYVHARRAVIRDVSNVPYQGFRGTDLTVFSTHLFDGHTVVDWCYQEVPDSIVWCVRDDGVLLGLTDMEEQQVQGWHRHDTLGTVLACCTVPEGSEDRLYLAVARNGQTVVERMASRFVDEIVDACFVDSSLVYDGRNTVDTKTMTLSGGVTWDFDELLTCTCSSSEFTAPDIGNAVLFTDDDGLPLLFAISGYTSPTVVTGFANRTVPAELQVATSTWARAVDTVTGLDHLEGLDVSVTADGYVVANPNNPKIDTVVTVLSGTATLDRPYGCIRVGLPYVSDLETLDIDTPGGPSIKDRKIKIDRVTLEVLASRGIFAGSGVPASDDVLSPLYEMKLRDDEDWGTPCTLLTRTLQQNITNSWSYEGRIFVRQVDPMPLSVLAVIPTGTIQGS